jgi:hypothetical protein
MATAPVLDPFDSRSTGQDDATLGFQRLQRVRARQRARRRHRLVIATLLVTVLAVTGVFGFTAARRTWPAPETPRTSIATPADRATADTPPPAPRPAPLADVPRNALRARRVQPNALPPTRPAASVSDGAGETTPVPSPAEPTDADPVDATAVIDWLLRAPRGH